MAILVLSAHVEVEHAMDLLAGGDGLGYLLKSQPRHGHRALLEALDRVMRGGSVVDPALVQELVTSRHVQDPLEELSLGSERY